MSGGVRRFVLGLGRWRWRLVGLLLVVLAYLLLWIINVHSQYRPITDLLVIGPVFLVLIVGGSALNGWLGVRHRPPQFADPDDPGDAERTT